MIVDPGSDPQGFLLIELLVAIALLGLLAVPVMDTFITGYLALAGAGSKSSALNLARQEMEQVKSMGYTGAYLYYVQEGNSPEEQREGPFTLETWVIVEPAGIKKTDAEEIRELELLRVRIAVLWGGPGREHRLELVSLLAGR